MNDYDKARTKFAMFTVELSQLCKKHNVELLVNDHDEVHVCDLKPGYAPLRNLDLCDGLEPCKDT